MTTFQNRQNWPPCQGYSLCKMLNLGQKLTFPKACGKRLQNYSSSEFFCKIGHHANKTRVVWLQKKTPNIRKMTTFPKSAKLATMPRLQPLRNPKNDSQFGSKIKIPKNIRKNDSRTTSRVFLSKKRLLKTPNIRKMTTFPKSAKLATMPRLQPLQNSQFGSKIKIPKSMNQPLPKTSEKRLYNQNIQSQPL